MTEPTKEQLDKWREDFKKLSFYKVNGVDMPLNTSVNESGQFESVSTDFIWMGYLAAKKSDFEEIKTLKEQLAEAVDVIRKCRNHNYLGGEAFLDRITEHFLEKQDKENKDEK